MGQLLPGAGHEHRQPPARPPRHRHLLGPGRGAGLAGVHAATARRPHHRRAVLFRHPLHRAAHAGRIPAARGDQALPRTERLTLPEKKGCRTICTAFFHGTEVASERVDAEIYAAFNRAVREAVRRINADKRAYLHYFIDYYAKSDPEIAALEVEDLRESRLVVCDPAPIPLEEMQRTYEWLKGWGMLEATASPLDLVNMDVARHAHQAAE